MIAGSNGTVTVTGKGSNWYNGGVLIVGRKGTRNVERRVIWQTDRIFLDGALTLDIFRY